MTITAAGDNGIYNNGGTIESLSGLTITGATGQGINNTGSITAETVQISGSGKNGVYNNGGTAAFTGLTVTDPGEHGVSNQGTMVLTDATLNGSGKGSNCIQNKGELTLSGVTASGSANHGIYNDSVLISNGKLTVTGAAVNGVYNYGGQVKLTTTEITGSGEHGVNNAGIMEAERLTIDGVTANGIQNTGELLISGSADITNSGKHGLYNGKVMVAQNITVTNAGDLLASNSGELTVKGMILKGTAHKALYNNGYAELYGVNVDGTAVTNGGSAEYLLDNNGGVLDLTDATIQDASGTALHLRGQGCASVTNVIIDGAGNYGIFVEGGSTLSGDGLVVNNITKNANVSGAEGYAIKNQGKITMMDHVTLGAYDDDVTGDGNAVRKETSGIYSTALTNDAAAASYSGLDLVIMNAKGGNGIYNKGTLFVTDLVIDGANHGLVTRYQSWATLSGDVSITDINKNPISIYGPEGSTYVNGITLTSGTTLLINGAGSHAINNKGFFLAAADTAITIRNIIGQNINAINNQSGGKMTLGNVTIDGVYVTISMYDDTTINSNSGNGIQSNSTLEINGDVVISNLFHKAENSKTENSNGSGVVIKNGGSITGTGSITVIGSQTAPEGYDGYAGLYNGIFNQKCTLEIEGDIFVSDAKNQGIYVADANATVGGGNITIIDSKGNGIYVNNASGKLTATGDITITGTTGGHGLSTKGTVDAGSILIDGCASGKQGLNLDGNKAVVNAANITVKNSAGNGIYVNNASGKITVTGDITITGTTGGHGLSTNGPVSAANVTIENTTGSDKNGIEMKSGSKLTATGTIRITNSGKRGLNNAGTVEAASLVIDGFGENGIQNSGTLTVSGSIDVSNGTGTGHGIYNGKTLSAGSIAVTNVTRNGINNGGEFTVTGAVSVKNAVEGGIGSSKTFSAGSVSIDTVTAGPGINNSGTFTVTGLTSVKNITGTDVSAIQNKNTMTLGDTVIDSVYVTVGNDSDGAQMTNVGNGITNVKKLTLKGAVAITNVFTTAKNNSIGAGVVVAEGGTVDGSGSLTITGSASTNEVYPYGINNGIFIDASTLSITGDITVSYVTNQGIYVANENAVLGAGNVTIQNVEGNGIYVNKTTGSANITGNVTIDGTNNHGLSNSGTVTAGSMIITNIPKKNGLNNTGTVTVAGKLDVSKITAGYGVYSKGGSVTAGEMSISDISGNIALFFEGDATIKAGTVSIKDVPKAQAIQMNHKNTLEVGTLIIQSCGKNGLRIYNNSGTPTIQIGNMVAVSCAEYAVAAQKAITDSNLSIGTLWYTDCTKGALHGNVKSGVGEVKNELPAAEASASAAEDAN